MGASCACRYGSAVFRSHLFGSATVVTADAEVNRFVLQSDARSFVPWYPRSLTELMGKSSILLINGSLQRRVHGLVGAFFKSPQLKAQVTADMQRRLAPALAAWREQGPGARLRIQDHAKTVRHLRPSIHSLHRSMVYRRLPIDGSVAPSG